MWDPGWNPRLGKNNCGRHYWDNWWNVEMGCRLGNSVLSLLQFQIWSLYSRYVRKCHRSEERHSYVALNGSEKKKIRDWQGSFVLFLHLFYLKSQTKMFYNAQKRWRKCYLQSNWRWTQLQKRSCGMSQK